MGSYRSWETKTVAPSAEKEVVPVSEKKLDPSVEKTGALLVSIKELDASAEKPGAPSDERTRSIILSILNSLKENVFSMNGGTGALIEAGSPPAGKTAGVPFAEKTGKKSGALEKAGEDETIGDSSADKIAFFHAFIKQIDSFAGESGALFVAMGLVSS